MERFPALRRLMALTGAHEAEDDHIMEQAGTTQQDVRDLEGKYLTFALGDETYGLGILKVQEIIRVMPVTRVPRTQSYVRGVINLRGKVIPVMDLRIKFGMDSHEDTVQTCIVVTQVEREGAKTTIGLVVDRVAEVVDIRAEQIELPPTVAWDTESSYVVGMGKVADKVVQLLGIEQVVQGVGEIHDHPQSQA